MNTYIAILRGINVGGKRKILMADLKALMVKLGFTDVRTYIQSGNVIFQSKLKRDLIQLADEIEKAIKDQFSFDVPCIIISSNQITRAIEQNPFLKGSNISVEQLHLTFLKSIPNKEKVQIAESYDFSPDQFKIIDDKAYVLCKGKYHLSKLVNTFFEKKLGVTATTRNWKTVLKLAELSGPDN